MLEQDKPGPDRAIDPLARLRERSMLTAGISDFVLVAALFATGLWANSLMMLAEGVRALLLVGLEMVLLVVLRRIHRGRMHAFDYGAGKIEQFANLGIGAAMGLAGLSVAIGAAYRWWNPPHQAEVGLLFAAMAGAVNVAQNAYVLRALWRAGGDGSSVILMGQVRTRLGKLISSGLVLVALGVNAAFGDGPVGAAAEVVGSAFVALVMLQVAVGMFRQALPSLLDRTLEEAQQHLINRALVSQFDAYEELMDVRSRMSGNVPLVDVTLGFAAHRTIGEIQSVVDALARDIQTLIPGAVVTVTPVACRSPGSG